MENDSYLKLITLLTLVNIGINVNNTSKYENTINKQDTLILKDTLIIRDTLILKDTIYIENDFVKKEESRINLFNSNDFFSTEEDIILFCKYIKTQSNDVLTTKGLTDQIFVIQVMFNRMKDNKCNWREYYNNNSINCSNTIKKMKKGKRVKFNLSNKKDSILYENVLNIVNNTFDKQYLLEEDVLYFHSNKRIYGNSPWLKEKYLFTIKHHFFKK